MIYLDNAATSRRKPQEVIDAVVFAMTSLGNAGRGTTEAALDAARTIYGARDKIAEAYQAAEQEKGQLRDRLRELEEKGADPTAADPAEIEAAVDTALAGQAKEHARQMQELQEKLRSATIQEDELQKKLAKAKADLAEARQNAKKAKAEGEAANQAAAEAAKREAEEAKREAEQLRKQLAMSDPATAEFKAHFATAQAELDACRRIAEDAPPEVREKLQAAMVALGKTLEG